MVITYQIPSVVDEAERSGDGDGVVDVDGLRGDVREGDVGEDHLLAGGRKSIEPRRSDKA